MPTWLYTLRGADPHRIQLNRIQRSRSCRDPHGIREELAADHGVEVLRIGMELHYHSRPRNRGKPAPAGACEDCWHFRTGRATPGHVYHRGSLDAGVERVLCDGCWVDGIAGGVSRSDWLPGPLTPQAELGHHPGELA
jgi:hypothetical protein